jgi:Asp/Glu/hydantoin racemase
MKIFWNEATSGPSDFEPLWQLLNDYFPKVARPDTIVEVRHQAQSGNFIRSQYTELINNRNVVENALNAQVEGYDAVVLGCWADPLWELRSEMDIPVHSIGEASFLMAMTLGLRFAVITVAPGVVPLIEKDLWIYGLEKRAIYRPVRSLEPASDAELLLESIKDPETRFLPNFERVALQCIADGAEVIIVGCGYYGPILSVHGYNQIPGTGVPVLDCSVAGLKLAEAQVDLQKSIGLSKSTALYFKPTPADLLKRVRQANAMI